MRVDAAFDFKAKIERRFAAVEVMLSWISQERRHQSAQFRQLCWNGFSIVWIYEELLKSERPRVWNPLTFSGQGNGMKTQQKGTQEEPFSLIIAVISQERQN